MGIIREANQEHGVVVEVVERTKGEYPEPWRIIHLDFDGHYPVTPKELRELGRFLVKQGKRIGKEYTSKGARRQFKCECGTPVHLPGKCESCSVGEA